MARADDAVSEVLGNVLLTAMLVAILAGFVGVVLSTVLSPQAAVPIASFSIEPKAGGTFLDASFVSGSSFALADTAVRLLVNGTERAGSTSIVNGSTDGMLRPGDTLRVNLTSGAFSSGDTMTLFVLRPGSGQPIAMVRASVPGAAALPAYVLDVPTVLSAASQGTLFVDGHSRSTLTVTVDASRGLALVSTVTVNLSPIGGDPRVMLRDDGVSPDSIAGDGVYAASITANDHAFATSNATETVPLVVTVTDIVGHTATLTLNALIAPTPQPPLLSGATYSPILPSSRLGWLNLTTFTFRNDSALANDQIELRVFDDNNASRAWTALVSFNSTSVCGGVYPGVSRIELTRDGVAGSSVWTPAGATCFSLAQAAQLDLADINASLNATLRGQAWNGGAAGFNYSDAGISASNHAVITFLGDTQSLAPADIGLGQANLTWGPREVPNVLPTAAFSVTQRPDVSPYMNVSVDGSASTDQDGSIAAYAWAWGDSSTGSGATANHTYSAAGVFTITLNVTDNSGGTGTATTVVVADHPPAASFTCSVSTLTANVDASASNDPDAGQNLTFAWEWGDGQTTSASALATASHAYATGGNYTINLTVRDPYGLAGTAGIVAQPNRAPTISSAVGASSNLTAFLNASASDPDGQTIGYAVNWGDGNTTTSGNGATASHAHAYAIRGAYTATLYVNDSFGRSTNTTVPFTVGANTPPTIDTLTNVTSGIVGFVNVTASDADAGDSIFVIVVAWGDGATNSTASGTANVQHTYTAGTFLVTIYANDTRGGSTVATRTLTPNRAPTFTALTNSTTDLNATLSPSASDPDGQTITYTYAWGDATSPTTTTATPQTHAYALPGNFTVTVYANDTLGGSASLTNVVTLVQTIYAGPTDVDAGTPGGTWTGLANITNVGGNANLTESATASSNSEISGCDTTFASATCSVGGLNWHLNSTSTGGVSGWNVAIDASQGTPTADGALQVGALANGANIGIMNYYFNLSGSAGTSLTNLTLNWKIQAQAGAGTRGIAAYLIAPNGTSAVLGRINTTGTTGWGSFYGTNVSTNFLTGAGTYLLRVDYLTNKNGDAFYVDNFYLNWTQTNYYRAQKELNMTPVPNAAALHHYLEVSGRQSQNLETLQIQVFDGSTWNVRGNVTTSTLTQYVIPLNAVEVQNGYVRVRLVDAASTGDVSQSAWEIDYVRDTVRG